MSGAKKGDKISPNWALFALNRDRTGNLVPKSANLLTGFFKYRMFEGFYGKIANYHRLK